MTELAAVIIAIVFAILIVLDIIGHRKYQVRRKTADWIFLCIFIAAAGLSVVFAVRGISQSAHRHDSGPYLAYHYLMDEDAEGARSVLVQDENIESKQREFLEMLSFGVAGEYKRLFFAADEFLSDPSGLADQKAIAEEIYALAMTAVADGTRPKDQLNEYIRESYEISGITETAQLQEYYDLDKKIRSNDTEGITSSKILALTKSFPDETCVKKLAISYFVQVGDFDSALMVAQELMETDKSPASQIIYTDILAQRAFQMTEEEIRAQEDPEIAGLIKKSDAAAQKALSYDEGSDNAAKQTELSREYLESAYNVYYQRVTNYITAKKPMTGDKTGLLSLQNVKMELLRDDAESAKEDFMEILEEASGLNEDSPVREPLLQMAADIALYIRTGEREYKDAVFDDCYLVFAAESQGVIDTGSQDINSYTAGRLAAMTVYDREIFAITDIDTSGYPKVTVSLNTNIQKENMFGGSGEFYKDDFRMKDNEETIGDFNMTARIGVEDRSTVIAINVADETMMNELRFALKLVPDIKLAKRTALADGSASVVSSFGDSTSKYLSAVRELSTENNASVTEIIESAVGALDDKKYEDRTIVFITDNTTLSEEEALQVNTLLKEYNVRCCVIAKNGIDEAAMRLIADDSGGYLFGIDRPEEITSALVAAADLMNNYYIFSYKADENAYGRHTVTVSLIKEENTDSADYIREAAS